MKYTTCDHARTNNREQSRHHKWRKRNLEWDDEVRSTTYQRDKTRKHRDERWGDWTRRCSGDGDWAVSCVDVVVKILISSGIAEVVVDEFTTVQRCWEMKRKKK